jgi:hypothetical protein
MAAIEVVNGFATSFEPGLYSGADAKKLVCALSELRRISTSLLMLAAGRVEETRLHEREGHKRAGSWLAGLTGDSVGQAASMLEAAKSIQAHPEISEAFFSGRLSEAQAKEITSAADLCPSEASNLVEAAETMELGQLKRHCADLRSTASSDDESIDRYEQMRKRRYCRIWKDGDFGRLDARVTPDAIAVLQACLEPFRKEAFEEARNAGRHESFSAYMADGLVAMAKASRSTSAGSKGAGTLVRVRVDLAALKRGHPVSGETCSIPGLGPIPVALVREILGDSVLELIVTEGQDVTAVCTNSRYIQKALRIALEERDETCCVPACDTSDPLEIDHFRTDYAKGGETRLDNLARLCPYHHHQKTYRGWRLEGGPGNWRFVGPDPPGEPEKTDLSEHSGTREPSRKTDASRQPAATGGAANGRGGTANRPGGERPSTGGGAKRATGPPGQTPLL